MKKTIIALMALAGVASAGSVGYNSMTEAQKEGVVLTWDFSDGLATPDVGTVTGTFTLNDEKTAAVYATGAGHPYVNGLASQFASGDFTLSFDIYSYTADNWQSFITLYSLKNGPHDADNYSLQIGVTDKNGKGELSVFNKVANQSGFAGINGTSGNIGTGLTSGFDGEATVTLVSDMSNTQTLSLYVDGKYIGQHTGWYATDGQAINQIKFGATGTDSKSGREFPNAEFGNMTIWNKALTATEVKALIPEPTTATLSLLALASLAARRRRASR